VEEGQPGKRNKTKLQKIFLLAVLSMLAFMLLSRLGGILFPDYDQLISKVLRYLLGLFFIVSTFFIYRSSKPSHHGS
jgi:hypothetical protein